MVLLNDDELEKLAQWVDDHYEGNFMVDGRPLTGVEMFALGNRLSRKIAQELLRLDQPEQ